MTSKVEIVNLALSSLGSKQTIQDLDDDNSVEARTANLHYEPALRTLLEDSTWSFCTTTATSALLTADPPADWEYMYAWPADAVRILGIVDPLESRLNKPRKFKKETYNGQLVLLTDTESPVWRYVYFNNDPATYTGKFVDALSAQLAYRLAMPLTRKRELKEEALNSYMLFKSAADASDANEQTINAEPDYTAPWHEARGYDRGDGRYLRTNADGTISEIEGNL